MRSSRSIRRWGAAALAAAAATAATLVALPAGTAQAQAGCLTADYQPSIWEISTGGGFVASIVLTNDCGTAVSGWTLVLTYGETEVMLQNSWSGIWRQEGDRIIGESQAGSWDHQIGPGASLHVGFIASFVGAYHDPTMCSVNGGPCDPAPNQPPEVSVSLPTDDSGLPVPCPATLIATAGDPDGTVDRVEFYLDDELVGTADTAPYQVEVPSAGLDVGDHVVVARAFDDQDASADSEPVGFAYQPPPPGLSIIGCVAGTLPVPEGGSQAAQLRNACGGEREVTATVTGDAGITVAPESFVLPLTGAEVTVSAAPGSAGAAATVTFSSLPDCISGSFPVVVTEG